MDKLRAALQSIISHWDEFGPEHGLDELIHRIRPMLALTAVAPAQSDEDCAAYIMKQWGLSVAPQEMVEILRRHRTQVATAWLPIETASKDGRHLWAIEAETGHHMEVWWDHEKGHGEGFMTHSDAPRCNGTDFAHFSHWMPLPAAPSAGDK